MRFGSENASVRAPAVAGMFDPDDPAELRDAVEKYLSSAYSDFSHASPKALIVPHAGYIYSGSVAAAAYASIAARRQTIRRVLLIGPSHRVYLRGLAAPTVQAFETPLGAVPIDRAVCAELIASGEVIESDAPHAQEHCLEVQLPFLQVLLGEFELVPLVVGAAAPAHVGSVLQRAWGDESTLVLISSDLSHYHSYEIAQHIDSQTSELILRRSPTLQGEQACGAVCINGLLHLARELHLQVQEIERKNSGDTAGDKSRVVGYGAFAVHDGPRP
ncbi:MAG: AmmeMemoRadiSam system protein B [Povalibacter sp.]